MKGTTRAGAQTAQTGDSYYDIKIKVDSIANYYDVDKLMTRINKAFAQDGAFSNANIISTKMRY